MRRRGFTLIEVLIAIALIGMLSGSVFAFLWTLVARRDVMQDRSMEAAVGSAFIGRLESDVMCGLAGDDSAGAGIVGTATSLKLLTRGVWLPTGAGDRAGASGDLQASEYVFSPESGTLEGRRWAVTGGDATPPGFETISPRVQRLRLRYSDGTVWHDSFDSGKAGTLPVAIEVAIWFGAPGPAPVASSAAAGDAKGGSGSAALDKGSAGTSGEDADSPRAASGGGTQSGTGGALPSREPDRLRIIVVPDGPVSSWKEAR